MKTIVTALFTCALCIATGCSKSPTQAPAHEVVAAPTVAEASPAARYLGLWEQINDPMKTVEITTNGPGYIMKYQNGKGRPKHVMTVTFEQDGSMRTSAGTSATIDVSSGVLMFGVNRLKRIR